MFHAGVGWKMPRLLDVDIFTDVAGPTVQLDGYSDRGFSVNGVDQPEIAAMGYIRNSNNHQDTTVTLTTIIELSASDVINVKFARGAQTGTVNLQGPNSSLMLLKVA